jgi:hypothetical protein
MKQFKIPFIIIGITIVLAIISSASSNDLADSITGICAVVAFLFIFLIYFPLQTYKIAKNRIERPDEYVNNIGKFSNYF